MADKKKKNKPRVITRTYVSKKTGEVVTKTYTYDYTQKQGASLKKRTQKIWEDSSITTRTKLITKSGRLNVNKIQEVASKANVDAGEIRAFLKAKYRDIKTSIPATVVLSFMSHNRVQRFLLNMGVDIDELVTELSMINPAYDKEYVLNEVNWTGASNKNNTYSIDGPLKLTIEGSSGVVDFYWDYYGGSSWEVIRSIAGEK